MRLLPLLAIGLLAVGSALLARGLLTEGGQVALVLIFPVFALQGPLSTVGAVLIFLSVLLGFLSLASFGPPHLGEAVPGRVGPLPEEGRTGETRRRRFGGILLLGPVPIVFGSDAKITVTMLILAIVLTVVLLVLFL